jgi:hypothetical protein
MGAQLGGGPYLSHFHLNDIIIDIKNAHLDLAMVNQVIELTFDPEFKGKLF